MQPQPLKMEYKCSQRWERMPEKDGQKLCGQCNTVVHDLTEKSTEEILALIQRHNNQLCGYVFEDQLRPGQPHKPFSVKVVIAGLTALFTLGAARVSAQNAPVVTEQRLDTTDRSIIRPFELFSREDIGPHPDCADDQTKSPGHKRLGRHRLFTIFGRTAFYNGRFPFLHVRRLVSGRLRW